MKIDRSNYELWFIDWLDGKLDDAREIQLKLFLEAHLDLRQELEDIEELRIDPPSVEFRGKQNIIKGYSDLSDLQFDYLCAAHLENDLSEEAENELLQITAKYPEKNKVMELFKKTKLVPSDISFKNKKILYKETPLHKIVRISALGLSAAATVAIIIVSYFLISGKLNSSELKTSLLLINEGRAVHSDIQIPAEDRTYIAQNIENHYEKINQGTSRDLLSRVKEPSVALNTTGIPRAEMAKKEMISSVRLPVIIYLPPLYSPDTGNPDLIKLSFDSPSEAEENRVISRFLAKTFREKILKEETHDDSPIKGYEIAEAGVSGLNKLFGWQMAFEKNNDENGEIRSIYFTSKILKIQSPVNRTEVSE